MTLTVGLSCFPFMAVVLILISSPLSQELTAEYSVSSMPTFIFFKNGQKIESFSGASENKLREMIEKYK